MHAYYVLVVNDSEDLDGHRVPAIEVAKRWLSDNEWPMFKRTFNMKQIRAGDKCLVYLAGYNELSQHIVYKARVKAVIPPGNGARLESNLISEPAASILKLEEIEQLNPPCPVREILPRLSFRPENMTKWGRVFQGGCRKISESDYNMIVSK